jgi:type II restriction enzyme
MTYLYRINALKARLEGMGSPARLDLVFEESRPPTQAFSEFLTNKEQGDWAERTFVENFNRSQAEFWAVKYGRSEDLVAGEPGFDSYYRRYQDELRTIGKRPDLLIFARAAYADRLGEVSDISTMDRAELDPLVRTAVAAIEVRSSAFLSRRYDLVALETRTRIEAEARGLAHELLTEHVPLLAEYPDWQTFLTHLVRQGIDPAASAPRVISRRSTAQLSRVSDLTKELKQRLKLLTQRDFLSLTPKAEDLTLVYRWIQSFGVPHHYCQVFFDRAVMLSFEEILEILATPERENRDYFIESDEKNQGKVTFKINVQLGREVLYDISLPRHQSAMKELPKGRLLFYVRFNSSLANVTREVLVDG